MGWLAVQRVCVAQLCVLPHPTALTPNPCMQRDKPLGSEPWFNPEAVTEQKVMAMCTACSTLFRLSDPHVCRGAAFVQREWIEQQGVQEASWPEHIYESFFVVVSSSRVLCCAVLACAPEVAGASSSGWLLVRWGPDPSWLRVLCCCMGAGLAT